MATNYNEEEEILKENIVTMQHHVYDLFGSLTSFACTSCPRANISKRSPEYLITLDNMKCHLYNLMGLLRDFYADWPMQCDCMMKLEQTIDRTYTMAKYLFLSYDNAYTIEDKEEGAAIKLYDEIYKDAYKFRIEVIHVLTECLESHAFLQSYSYQPRKCVGCRYREDYSESWSDTGVEQEQGEEDCLQHKQ